MKKDKYLIKKYKSRNGEVVKIRKMTDSHLINAYNFFMKKLKVVKEQIDDFEEFEGHPECLDDILTSPLSVLYPMHKRLGLLLDSLEQERRKRKLKVKEKYEYCYSNSENFIWFP